MGNNTSILLRVKKAEPLLFWVYYINNGKMLPRVTILLHCCLIKENVFYANERKQKNRTQ